MIFDAESKLTHIGGATLEEDRLYDIVLNHFIVGANPVSKAYATEHPDCCPPEETGRSTLDIVREYFVAQAWHKLCDQDDSGAVSREDANTFFEEADKDGSGFLSVEEIQTALAKRLPDMMSSVLASLLRAQLDADEDGRVSRSELVASLVSTAGEVKQIAASERE